MKSKALLPLRPNPHFPLEVVMLPARCCTVSPSLYHTIAFTPPPMPLCTRASGKALRWLVLSLSLGHPHGAAPVPCSLVGNRAAGFGLQKPLVSRCQSCVAALGLLTFCSLRRWEYSKNKWQLMPLLSKTCRID